MGKGDMQDLLLDKFGGAKKHTLVPSIDTEEWGKQRAIIINLLVCPTP
jgi:hypothetical protein